jgi:HSP20 family molecular chaperone IbpA
MANPVDPWLPLPFQRLSQEVDRLFDEMIHRPWGARRGVADWNPQLDLYETASAFILEADLPGVRKQDVSVTVEDGNLVVQGRRETFTTANATPDNLCDGYVYLRPSLQNRSAPIFAMASCG